MLTTTLTLLLETPVGHRRGQRTELSIGYADGNF